MAANGGMVSFSLCANKTFPRVVMTIGRTTPVSLEVGLFDQAIVEPLIRPSQGAKRCEVFTRVDGWRSEKGLAKLAGRVVVVPHHVVLARPFHPRLPICGTTMSVSDSYDQDATHFDAIHDAERVSAQEVVARAMIVWWPRVGILPDRGHGRIDFIPNASAADALRSAYQRAAASASSIASSRYSTARATSSGCVYSTTSLRPRDCCGYTGIHSIKAGTDLGRPCRFCIRVDLRLEALNEFAR